jgi:hypothetical protein
VEIEERSFVAEALLWMTAKGGRALAQGFGGRAACFGRP